MIHVFIIGSKGIPARYGGFETFVENLTAGKQRNNIKYHVSCMNNDEKHFEYNSADCFNVRVPLPGAPGRICHVGLVLKKVEKWVKLHKDEMTIVYILGCRIGPLLIPHSRKLHKLGVKIYCNPDGLEWSIQKITGSTEIEEKDKEIYEKAEQVQESTLILPDYSFKENESTIGTSVSGIVGCGITVAVLCGIGYIIKLTRKKEKLNG